MSEVYAFTGPPPAAIGESVTLYAIYADEFVQGIVSQIGPRSIVFERGDGAALTLYYDGHPA